MRIQKPESQHYPDCGSAFCSSLHGGARPLGVATCITLAMRIYLTTHCQPRQLIFWNLRRATGARETICVASTGLFTSHFFIHITWCTCGDNTVPRNSQNARCMCSQPFCTICKRDGHFSTFVFSTAGLHCPAQAAIFPWWRKIGAAFPAVAFIASNTHLGEPGAGFKYTHKLWVVPKSHLQNRKLEVSHTRRKIAVWVSLKTRYD